MVGSCDWGLHDHQYCDLLRLFRASASPPKERHPFQTKCSYSGNMGKPWQESMVGTMSTCVIYVTTLCSEVGWVCLNVHERMWMMTNMRYHRKKASPSWTPFHPFVDFGAPPNHGAAHVSIAHVLWACETAERHSSQDLISTEGVEVPTVECFSLVHQAEKNTFLIFLCI